MSLPDQGDSSDGNQQALAADRIQRAPPRQLVHNAVVAQPLKRALAAIPNMALQIGKQIRLTSVFVFLLLTPLLTTSCKHEKYDSIRDATDWKNPFLIIEGNGVEVLVPDDRAHLTMDKLQDYLFNLPDRYWPYGKIVAVQEAGLRSGNDDELILQNKAQTIQILKSLGIKIKFWNTIANKSGRRAGTTFST